MQNSTETPRNTRAIQARLNGAKSRGPITPQGKQISSQNALKHGFYSPTVVLNNENQAEFDALLTSLTSHFQPTNDVEVQLISQMATAQWRMDRCHRIETAFLSGLRDVHRKAFDERNINEPKNQFLEDMRTAEVWRDMMQESCLAEINQTEARFQRQYTRALTTLLKLRRPQTHESKNPQNEPKESKPITQIDTNELPTLTKNRENEPSNSLKTQRQRILDYCASDAYLNTFAPRLHLVHQGKLTYDQYLAEIRESVATLLNIKNHQNEPSSLPAEQAA